jgi:pimeloyl-ACP methyl ester carboxylesterase
MTPPNELPLVFGSDRHLVGTLTMPATGPTQRTAFVLLNAGVIHRIGPHRINVKLARELASQGFNTLRFDLSGQGDSRAPSSSGDFTAQAVADIRAAMDHLERTTDVHRFVIAGICSGADNGLAAALADDRVVGLCLLDGYTYPTSKTRWVRLKRRLRGPLLSAVLPWALRRLTALSVAIARRRGDALALVDNDRRFPSREEFAASMQTLVDRGVEVCLVYSGSLLPQYNYDDQFRDAFAQYGFATRVRSEYRPDIDHSVTPVGAQQQLLELVSGWARTLPQPA